MNKLYVESNQSFTFGFVLTEQELRRTIDLCIEQLKKDNATPTITQKFTIKYANGAVGDTDNLDLVISEENSGSSQIISLDLEFLDNLERKITINFSDIDSNGVSTENSVKYSTKGDSRDWVFVTSSQLEERLKKVSRFSLNTSKKRYRLLWTLIFPIGFLIPMLGTLIFGSNSKERLLQGIKADWIAKKLTDPIDAMIRIAEANASMESLTSMKYTFIILGIITVLVLLLYIYIKMLYPIHNFCWGDYLETFKRKESTRKTVNSVVIIGLIISIIGGLIANWFGKI
ncbi:MAG: hypothetical protein JNM00_03220 [Flavobacteriales bacterium]|nr:hypothetical protein [Flavobacteriales bacterium]